jgi:hypothetical protein
MEIPARLPSKGGEGAIEHRLRSITSEAEAGARLSQWRCLTLPSAELTRASGSPSAATIFAWAAATAAAHEAPDAGLSDLAWSWQGGSKSA